MVRTDPAPTSVRRGPYWGIRSVEPLVGDGREVQRGRAATAVDDPKVQRVLAVADLGAERHRRLVEDVVVRVVLRALGGADAVAVERRLGQLAGAAAGRHRGQRDEDGVGALLRAL